MILNSIFGNSVKILQTCLNGYKARNRAISSNIANAEVKNYRKISVGFENNLKKAINEKSSDITQTNPAHLSKNSEINEEMISVEKSKFSNVGEHKISLDEEMVNLVNNQINYQTSAKVLNKMFGILRTAIKGR
ncbi:MAG: flagellar basal body rod protein FlgB [Candidatus Cloacimonadota bacterium]|nr:flagellar basal body rod protein FlgB [Candidatus Cloacimonadota bacterium]